MRNVIPGWRRSSPLAQPCALSQFVLLTWPGTRLDVLWLLNPEAQRAFRAMEGTAHLLMATVGLACLAAAIGLWRGTRWGARLAVVVLVADLLGDLLNVFLRGEYRALLGVPVAGAMIVYLMRGNRDEFDPETGYAV